MNNSYKPKKAKTPFQKINLKNKAHESDIERKTYDLTNSGEINQLYQKNKSLLSELSSTGRKNTILQTELCSLIEEKSKLGVENSTLSSEVAALKRTVSRFKDQEKRFYDQSLRLKNQFRDFQITEAVTSLSSQSLSKKQEQVFSEKLIRFLRYRKKVKQIHSQLKKQQTQQKEKIDGLEKEIKHLQTHHKPNIRRFGLQLEGREPITSTYLKVKKPGFNKLAFQKREQELKVKVNSVFQEKKIPQPFTQVLKAQLSTNQAPKQEDQHFKQQIQERKETIQNLRAHTQALEKQNQSLRQETEIFKKTKQELLTQTQKLEQENQSKQKHIQLLSSRLIPLVKYRSKIKAIHPYIKRNLKSA